MKTVETYLVVENYVNILGKGRCIKSLVCLSLSEVVDQTFSPDLFLASCVIELGLDRLFKCMP